MSSRSRRLPVIDASDAARIGETQRTRPGRPDLYSFQQNVRSIVERSAPERLALLAEVRDRRATLGGSPGPSLRGREATTKLKSPD